MENSNPTTTNGTKTTPNPNLSSIREKIESTAPASKTITLRCNVRLKKGLVSIPNQAEEEFSYSIDSILAQSGGPLKGVTGVLERTIMPSIIDVSVNDNTFNTHIKEYWANFSNHLPADSVNKRDTEQGIPMSIKFTLYGSYNIEAYEKTDRVDAKFKFIHDLFERQETENRTGNSKLIYVDTDSYPDFVKLAFILKHSRIANRVEDKDKSPKLYGYIYEKEIAVKAELSEMDVFSLFSENLNKITDEKRANAILLALKENVSDADSLTDKKIIIYNLGKKDHATRVLVNRVLADEEWEYKYYVQMGLHFQILKQPVNSKMVQYQDSIIGNDIESAANYLKNDATGASLLHLIKSKLTT